MIKEQILDVVISYVYHMYIIYVILVLCGIRVEWIRYIRISLNDYLLQYGARLKLLSIRLDFDRRDSMQDKISQNINSRDTHFRDHITI